MAGDLQATFIVRLRHEPGTPPGEWRGEVEHVQSAHKARFVDQTTLIAFVWSRLAEAERRPSSGSAPTSHTQRRQQ